MTSQPEPAASGQKIESAKKNCYAVVGLGYIAQIAVLPAFAHASAIAEPKLVRAAAPSK